MSGMVEGTLGEGERETWTTEEFGSSHEGAVGVLLADGSVPASVYFDAGSGGGGRTVSQWSVYDGRFVRTPRAAALCAVCSCGWTGPERALDWEEIGDQRLDEAAGDTADACTQDWDEHTAEVERLAVPLPEAVTILLAQLASEIEALAKTSPLAALRAARRLEVTAVQAAYGPVHDVRQDTPIEQVASALMLDEAATRKVMARFGRWSPYERM